MCVHTCTVFVMQVQEDSEHHLPKECTCTANIPQPCLDPRPFLVQLEGFGVQTNLTPSTEDLYLQIIGSVLAAELNQLGTIAWLLQGLLLLQVQWLSGKSI